MHVLTSNSGQRLIASALLAYPIPEISLGATPGIIIPCGGETTFRVAATAGLAGRELAFFYWRFTSNTDPVIKKALEETLKKASNSNNASITIKNEVASDILFRTQRTTNLIIEVEVK